MFQTVLFFVIAAVVVLQAYVRLAPSNVARWHVAPVAPETGQGDWPASDGHTAARSLPGDPPEVLARLDTVARMTPRTAVLAGGPEEGLVTYVTRSFLWGFPDYTTAAAVPDGEGTLLTLHGRLRFGGSDLGVNRTRISTWLNVLDE